MRRIGSLRRSLVVKTGFVIIVLLLANIVGWARPAQAAAGNILPPFDVGQQWNICRGYGYASHTGTSTYGLDLTGAGCDNSASGRTVRAPVSGTVYYYQASYGNLCINMPNGRSLTLTHINSSITSGTVAAGQAVGTVAAPGQRGNQGVAHIHMQMWPSHGCYNGAGIPFDAAHGARICGAPDLPASGGGGSNGMWSGTSFVGQTCGDDNPPPPPVVMQSIQHVFAGTTAGTLHETYWGEDIPRTTWQTGSTPGTSVAGVTSQITSDGVRHIYSGMTNGDIYETYWGGGTTLTHALLGNVGSPVTGITSVVTPDNVQHVYIGTQTGTVHEMYWGGGTTRTLHQVAVVPSAVTTLASWFTPDDVQHVYIGTQAGTLHEVYWGGGTTRTLYQLATLPAAISSISAQVTDGSTTQHVYAATTAGTLHETYWGVNIPLTTWQVGSISQPITSIATLITPGGMQHIYSGTATGALYETYWGAGEPLTTGQISTVNAAITSLDSWFTPEDNVQHVYIGTEAGGLHEVYWGPQAARTTYQLSQLSSPVKGISALVSYQPKP